MDKKTKTRRIPRWLPYILHAAVLGGIAVAATKYINGGEFTRAMAKFDWVWAPVICLLSLGYVLVKAERFVRMMREICPEVRSGALWRVYIAGQAATLVPGGTAARAAMLEQIGVPAAQTAAPLLIAAWSDQAVFLGCSLVAALWVEEVRKPVLALLVLLGLVSVVLGIEAVRTWLGRVIERILGHFDLVDHWREFTTSLKQVAKPRTLALGVGNAMLADALLIVALYLAVRGVGAAGVPIFNLILAFTLPTMLGRISALPGGVGVTEAGMIPLLDHAPNVTLDQAAASVAVFRLGSVLFAALVGALVYLFGWRAEKERQKAKEQGAMGANAEAHA